MMIRRRQRRNIEQCLMHAFRTYILPKFKQAAARSLCSCFTLVKAFNLPSIRMLNLRFVSSAIPEILAGSRNLKSRSRDLGHAPF